MQGASANRSGSAASVPRSAFTTHTVLRSSKPGRSWSRRLSRPREAGLRCSRCTCVSRVVSPSTGVAAETEVARQRAEPQLLRHIPDDDRRPQLRPWRAPHTAISVISVDLPAPTMPARVRQAVQTQVAVLGEATEPGQRRAER
ncbi:hypothetical protein ACRAWF_38325 [Streptomyces sp. L7]